MPASPMNLQVQHVMVNCGHVVIVAILIGMLWAGFLPPTPPSDSAAQISAIYAEHQGRIQGGCALMMIFWVLWAPWAGVLAMFIRRMTPSDPSLTYAALVCMGYGLVIFEFIAFFWVVAAYRPGEIAPDITLTLNDIAWFMFLYTWPPFALIFIIIAVAIFCDRNLPMIFPRWVAYLNLWCAVLLLPATLMSIYKTGSFAYDGLFGMWVPLVAFCIWMVVMSVLMSSAIKAERRKLAQGERAPRGAPALATVRLP